MQARFSSVVIGVLIGGCAAGQGGGQGGGPDADVGGVIDARAGVDAAETDSPDAREAADAAVPVDAAGPPDAPPAASGNILACSFSHLYRFDAESKVLSLVGELDWPATSSDFMFDIAIDRDGVLMGISQTELYLIDPTTAQVSDVAPLSVPNVLNGLTFVAAAELGQSGEDRLLGTATDGRYYLIDRSSGVMTQQGDLGSGVQSSGDVVSIDGTGTWATVLPPAATVDSLLPLQPGTGGVGAPAVTGVAGVWGLAWEEGQLYGFGSLGQVLQIDPATASAVQILDVTQTGVTAGFYGAAVRPAVAP